MKKLLAMLLTLVLLLSAIPAALAEQAPEISSRTATLYDHSASNTSGITLYFLNGQTDIPYIDMDMALELMNRISVFFDDPGYEVTMEAEGDTYMLTRENGSHAIVDFGQNLIGWDNYNLFITASFAIQPLDIVGNSGFNADGEPELFQRSSASFYRGSESMGVKLSDFEIELVYRDGMPQWKDTLTEAFASRGLTGGASDETYYSEGCGMLEFDAPQTESCIPVRVYLLDVQTHAPLHSAPYWPDGSDHVSCQIAAGDCLVLVRALDAEGTPRGVIYTENGWQMTEDVGLTGAVEADISAAAPVTVEAGSSVALEALTLA